MKSVLLFWFAENHGLVVPYNKNLSCFCLSCFLVRWYYRDQVELVHRCINSQTWIVNACANLKALYTLMHWLTLSCRRSLSHRDQSIDLLWFLYIEKYRIIWIIYNRDLDYERLNMMVGWKCTIENSNWHSSMLMCFLFS